MGTICSNATMEMKLVLTLRTLAFASLALVLGGIFGLSMVFSDIGPGESETRRIVVATLFFFLSGLGIGYLNPRAWTVSGLTAWGGRLNGNVLGVCSHK